MQQALKVVLLLFAATADPGLASEFVEGELTSRLVPSPVKYGVLLPDGYGDATEPLPILLLLHGGEGSHMELTRWRSTLESLWKDGKFPPAVVAMASTGKRLQYMDLKDGSEKWESFMTDFLGHIRKQYNVSPKREDTVIAGVSMGGQGTLRLGLKYPEMFAGIAAFEPGIMPAFEWKDVQPRNHFFREQELYTRIYGWPVDPQYWKANNPASIVKANADTIRDSGLQIYLECGDEDFLNLHEGAEFLHQVLWNCRIKHEYHLVRGADHLGRTIAPRTAEGLEFLGRVLSPPGPDPDPTLAQMKANRGVAKEEAERKSRSDAKSAPRRRQLQ
jgi:S-formylglutathione hydrolase